MKTKFFIMLIISLFSINIYSTTPERTLEKPVAELEEAQNLSTIQLIMYKNSTYGYYETNAWYFDPNDKVVSTTFSLGVMIYNTPFENYVLFRIYSEYLREYPNSNPTASVTFKSGRTYNFSLIPRD